MYFLKLLTFIIIYLLCFSQTFAKTILSPEEKLEKAIANPEYMLDHWIALPASPKANAKKIQKLTLKDAILLALRYNPNIQSAELERVVQRYQLRLAYNEFEFHFGLAASANWDYSRFEHVGGATNTNYLASPEVNLKTKMGTKIDLNMNNNMEYGNYNPLLNLTVTQPLLRGARISINEIKLLNALDEEYLNKLNLKQIVIDQITQVTFAWRTLISLENNLENQARQLEEAHKTYAFNEKKIKAGQLEPSGNIQQAYQIESLSLMTEQAQNDLEIAKQNLLEAIGLDPDTRLMLPATLALEKLQVPDFHTSMKLALKNNAAWLAQKLLIRAARRAYEEARDSQLWQLDLSTITQLGAVRDVTADSNRFKNIYKGNNLSEAAALTLRIPFDNKPQKSELINAKIKLEKDKIKLLAMRRALEKEIRDRIRNINSQIRRYELAKKQVALAEQSYLLEKKKLQAGISTALDVNNTQNQLLQAQSGLISSKIASLNELSNLQRTLGTTLEQWQIHLRYGE